jgi:DNA-directed RNA polymerase specialized sigma24 family protein
MTPEQFERLRQGNEDAWIDFYAAFVVQMRGVICQRYWFPPDDLDEIVNDALLKLWKVVTTRPNDFPNMATIYGYAFRVGWSTAVDRYRHDHRLRSQISQGVPLPETLAVYDTYELENPDELKAALQRALGEAYEPMLLRFGYDVPIAEICTRYKLGTAKDFYYLQRLRLSAAKRRLRSTYALHAH